MAYDEALASSIRNKLATIPNLPRVEEKKMFGGVCFMIDGKMCLGVSHDELLVRVDPAMHNELVKRKGARTMTMRNRQAIGYIYVNQQGLKEEFDYWLNLALDFNTHAKSAKKRAR